MIPCPSLMTGKYTHPSILQTGMTLTISTTYRISASSFLNGLDPFFRKIKALHDDLISLVQHPTHEKIRIAVLDSGVDDRDSMIRPAIRFRRINALKSKSFVGHPDEWQQDIHGHGTHVTQLLMKTAPAAEIYVGKICTGIFIDDELMPGIAKVGLPISFSSTMQVLTCCCAGDRLGR